MRRRNAIVFGFLSALGAVGLLGVNIYYSWLSERDVVGLPSSQKPSAETFARPESGIADESAATDKASRALYEVGDEARLLGSLADHLEMIQTGAGAQPVESAPPANPPRLLPDATDAAVAETPGRDWLRDLVQQELPDSARDERKVWEDELRGLPPEMARDILRLRQNVSNLKLPPGTSQLFNDARNDSVREPALPPADRLVPEPIEGWTAGPQNDGWLQTSFEAYENSQKVLLHNLTNAHSIGFKRSIPLLSSHCDQASPEDSSPTGRGVHFSGTTLDLTQGSLRSTEQAWNVAIEGPGFFQVRWGKEILVTRAGMIELNASRELCLRIDGKLLPLHPPVVYPETLGEPHIDAAGLVTTADPNSVLDTERSVEVGRIRLCNFVNPRRLAPRSGQCFAPTESSGPPQIEDPVGNLGVIRQGFLEESNVSPDFEREEFLNRKEHLELLKNACRGMDPHLRPGPVARGVGIEARRTSGTRSPFGSLEIHPQTDGTLIEEFLEQQMNHPATTRRE